MNIFTKSVSLAAILIAAGCTGCSSFPQLPPTEKVSAQIENYQLPQTPSEGKALVYIVRPSFVFGLVPFGVYVDGKDDLSRVGHNRTRQYIHFELEPGEHTIYTKSANWSEMYINAKAGETIFIEQEQNAFATNNLLKLSEDAGKYRVKKAKPGKINRTGA